jgi:hypothetical protein
MRFNRQGNRLAYVFTSIALAACGGGGGSDIDAAGGVDGPGSTIDSAPMPDGPPGAWDCIGDSHPTTAPATINVTGVAEEIDQNGTTPLENVTVTARDAADASLDSDTSVATTGAYALAIDTGGSPVNGYLHGTRPSGYKATYVYPPAPLATDLANIPVMMVSNTTYAFIPFIAGTEAQQGDEGLVGLLVVDCTGTPVAGATVTVSGADPANVRYPQGTTVPQDSSGATDASGIALVFNVPMGASVTVDASTSAYEFEEHTINVRPDAITTTVLAPGPITGLAP